MEQNLPEVRISVRNLVEFILREGDLDNRKGTGTDVEIMQLGSKIHRKLQRNMGADYQAEISLKTDVDCGDFIIRVEGRADGIIQEDPVCIDEIKGVLCELEQIPEAKNVHMAQAKCYAWMYGSQNGKEQMEVQVTYCQMETEEIKRFREQYSMKELESWFYDLIKQYEKWARFQMEWRRVRNASIKKIEFPFIYREGQKELVTSVYRTILRKKNLFIQAPTGVGKTMAAVFPAVKAVGEELGEKIFYLTAKTITRTVAEQAFDKLKEQGLKMKAVTLTAKEKICFCEKTECNPEYCPYAKGHYDRINDAVYELLCTSDELHREAIEKQARKHQVCPFEMGLDVSTWADAVICDYNYVFDPNAHLRRFFSEGMNGEYLFLIDEAHNLVDRGRQMYSAEICKEDFLQMKRMIKLESPKLSRKMEECNKALLAMKKECENYKIWENVSHIYLKVLNAAAEMEAFLEKLEDKETRDKVLELYFGMRNFMSVYEKLDHNYVIYSEFQDGGKFVLKLFCVNPAARLQEYLDMGNSTIFFSATLLPIQYYKNLLSTRTDNYAVYALSAFDTKKRLLLNGIDVSSRYTMRDANMYQKYARYIKRVIDGKRGNYIVFFPSYRYMEAVYEAFEPMIQGEDIECVLQSHSMNEEAREIFLETFEEEREGSLVGFCVMGGIFSEGINLTDEKLIGALIVGTGLPQVCNEREILKQYFEQSGLQGFDYAYLYPGMNKVLQAAGRVIRTEDDYGIILLLDERFRERRCRETFPREWADLQICRIEDVQEKIEEFWKKNSTAQ